MIRLDDIKTSLKDVVKWRQNYDVATFRIADSLVTGNESSKCFQDEHPLCILDNIKSLAPNFNVITYPTWSNSTQYYIGDRVTLSNVNYKALLNNKGKTPASNPSEWEVFTAFDEWLFDKTQASLSKTIERIIDDKIILKTARNIFENKPIFDGAGRLSDVVTNTSSLVGIEIQPLRTGSLTVKIDKIGFQCTTNQTLTLYLFHSSQKQPIKTKEITITTAPSMQWFSVTDWLLPYLSEYDAGGAYYLRYSQTDLTGQAINKTLDFSQKPCASCNGQAELYNLWSQYLTLHPFSNTGTKTELGDISTNVVTYANNYGLNLQLSVACDYTDFIIAQRDIFKTVIGKQLALDMLREMAFNPNARINRNEENITRQEILYEIDGDTRGRRTGLCEELEKAYKAIEISLEGLHHICLPCEKKGIRYKGI